MRRNTFKALVPDLRTRAVRGVRWRRCTSVTIRGAVGLVAGIEGAT